VAWASLWPIDLIRPSPGDMSYALYAVRLCQRQGQTAITSSYDAVGMHESRGLRGCPMRSERNEANP